MRSNRRGPPPLSSSPLCWWEASPGGCSHSGHDDRSSRSDERSLLQIFTKPTPTHNPGSGRRPRPSQSMATVSEPDRVQGAESAQQESMTEAVQHQSQAKLGELAAQHTPVPEDQREPV